MPVVLTSIWKFIWEKTSILVWISLALIIALWVSDVQKNRLEKALEQTKAEKTVIEEQKKSLESSLTIIKRMHEDYRQLSEAYMKSSTDLDKKAQEKLDLVKKSLDENPDAANFIIPENIRKSLEKQ